MVINNIPRLPQYNNIHFPIYVTKTLRINVITTRLVKLQDIGNQRWLLPLELFE